MPRGSEGPNLLGSAARALARALRWLGLAASGGALVYLVQVNHGTTGLTTYPVMASFAAILALVVAAGAMFVFSSTRPRNRILRRSSPALVLAGVAVFLTGGPETSARRYFDLHRSELDGLARELHGERPFRGSLRDAVGFPGRESLRRRLTDLGIHDVHLAGERVLVVFPLNMDGFHGLVHVERGGRPPTDGEAFFPDEDYVSYRDVRPLEGGWHHFQVVDLPATSPATGEPTPTGPPPTGRPVSTTEPTEEARRFFAPRQSALDTLIWEFGNGPIWHGRLEDVDGLESERRSRLLDRVRELGFREAFLESGRVVFVRDVAADTLYGVLWVAGTAPVPPRGGPLLAGYRFHRVALLGRFETHELWPIDGTWHAVRMTRLPEPWWTRQRTPPSPPDAGAR